MEPIIESIRIINEELGRIQGSMMTMQIDIAILKSQMAQVLTYQKIVLGAFLTMIVGIAGFIFRRIFLKIFNNRK